MRPHPFPAQVSAPLVPQLCDVPQQPSWITTYSGRQFFPMAPKAADILIEDIAHQLSCMNRWAGATREPYSIAQHSVHVAELVPHEHALWALLHDASEAYLVDVPTHIKRLPTMAPYRAAEQHLQCIIYQRFGLSGPEPESVKVADNALAVAEAQDLLKAIPAYWPKAIRQRTAARTKFTIKAWSAAKAEYVFLERFTAFARSTEVCANCKTRLRRPGRDSNCQRQRWCRQCHAANKRESRSESAE